MSPRVMVGVAVLAAVLWPAVAVAGGAGAGQTTAGRAQERGVRPGGPVSVAEAERLFDRYMLGQARVVLQLTADQIVPFGQRFERLQGLQRLRQRQRQRRLAELAALNRAGAVDEPAMAALLDALDTETADADAQVRAARADLDQMLSVRQRARYRAFEIRMEREKLQLIARARAEARARDEGPTTP